MLFYCIHLVDEKVEYGIANPTDNDEEFSSLLATSYTTPCSDSNGAIQGNFESPLGGTVGLRRDLTFCQTVKLYPKAIA
jgi:hypothetical protein